MRNILLIILIIFSACGFGYAEEARPRIEIVTDDIDIGEVEKGSAFDFKIEVRNAGAADLVIQSVSSDCGCLEVVDQRWPKDVLIDQVKPIIVKPRENILISVRVDTNKIDYEFDKMLHIFSNDPERPDSVWHVRGNVQNPAPGAPSADERPAPGPPPAVPVEVYRDTKNIMLFYRPGCKDCWEIRDNFLPELQEKYKVRILVEEYNIDEPEAFAIFLGLQDRYDEKAKAEFYNPKSPAVFIYGKFLYGQNEIKEGLKDIVNPKI